MTIGKSLNHRPEMRKKGKTTLTNPHRKRIAYGKK